MVANICFLNGIEGPENISLRLSNTPDNFLITLGNRRVVEYRMSDKTVINSYFLPSHMSYSTPMASTKFSSDSIKKELICVINKKHLYCWDGQENRLDDVKEKMELPHAAIDLIEDNGKILLVFENGDIQLVDHIIQQMSNSSEKQDGGFSKCRFCPAVILKTRILSDDGLKHCIHIGSNGIACLYRMTLDGTRYVQNYVKSFNIKKASHCDIVGNFLVWVSQDEQDTVQAQAIFDSTKKNNSKSISFRLSSVSKINSLAYFDSKRIALLCIGSDDQDSSLIKIFNMDYGIDETTIPLKAYSSNQLECLNGEKVIFKQGARFACWTVENLPRGLSDLVGCKMDQVTEELIVEDGGGGGISLQFFNEDGENSSSNDLIQKVLDNSSNFHAEQQSLFSEHLPDLVKISMIENALADPDNDSLLRSALLIPFTDHVALEHIRNLRFSSAKTLIHRLVQMMQGKGLEDSDEFEHFITWLALILDAHYTNFMIAKDSESKNIILECSQLLEALDRSFNMLASVMSRIKMANKETQLKNGQASNRHYAVEVVYF